MVLYELLTSDGVNGGAAVVEIDFDKTFIVEVPKAAHHGMNLDDFVVAFEVVSGGFIEFLRKFEVPLLLILDGLSDAELGEALYGEGAVFLDDLLDVCGELVVRVDLLFDEPVLLEVFVEDLPKVMFLNLPTHISIYYLNHALNTSFQDKPHPYFYKPYPQIRKEAFPPAPICRSPRPAQSLGYAPKRVILIFSLNLESGSEHEVLSDPPWS